MNISEPLVWNPLSSIVWEPYQFVYSVNDAVSLCQHSTFEHLEASDTDVRVLFVDYSSAFNTILPSRLCDKLFDIVVEQLLCWWACDFFVGEDAGGET